MDVAGEILARAAPGEVLVSRTVADLVAGARIGFADRGIHALAAVGDSWQLLATRAGGALSEPAADGPATLFRREGDCWTVAFGGQVIRMHDAKGLGIPRPSPAPSPSPVPRARPAAGDAPRGSGAASEDDLVAATPDAGVVLDATAKRAYRERIADLETEIEQARRWNAVERTARLESELDALNRPLAGALGLGGRDRRAASHSERARTSVTKALRRAVERLGNEVPELGRPPDARGAHRHLLLIRAGPEGAGHLGRLTVTAVTPDFTPSGQATRGGTMATQVQARDAMQFINEQDAATLERFIERLEYRGTDPTFVAYRDAYLKLVDLSPTAAVLDLGCGTGVVTRALAARDGFAGTVTGIDQSPDFIAAAQRLAADDGVGDRVEFVVGDVHELDLAAASFDAVVAHTLISHVRDPLAVLAEAARVVRPGRVRGHLRRRLRVADLRLLRPAAGRAAGARGPVDDHELARASCASFRACCRRSACGWSPRRPTSTPRLDRAASCSTWPGPTGRWWRRPACGPPATSTRGWPTRAASAEDGTFFAACNYYAYVAHAAI